jgi:hypothetical protein
MTGVALAESRTFESAETLARDVAEWLCDLAQASPRFRREPVWRLDAPAAL